MEILLAALSAAGTPIAMAGANKGQVEGFEGLLYQWRKTDRQPNRVED